METRRGYRINRRLDVTRRVAFLEAVPEGKGYVVLASRGRRERLRLPGFAVEDSGGLGRFLGERFRQRQPESTWVHSGPVLRLHHVGVAEEQGFKGVLLALGLYMALLLRLVQNAQRAKDRAGMFLVMGVAAALGFHVLVNVAMVIGAMPVTGIPLPLMSYGGSATLFVFLAIGLVMNVRLRRFVN